MAPHAAEGNRRLVLSRGFMAVSDQLINVAVPLPVAGPFTYRLPTELAARCTIGSRVFVPFRTKIRAGFVVPGPPNGDAPSEVRDVADVPEEPPYLRANLWEFIRWVADYYLLPVGLVLRTALPPGSDRRSRPWALLTSEGRRPRECQDPKQLYSFPRKLLKSGAMLLRELTNAIGEERVREAVNAGWVRVEERIARPRASLWKQRLPELLEPAGVRIEVAEEPPGLTADQESAFQRIEQAMEKGGFNPFLLFGVTGSGKTEVYLRAIQMTIAQGKRALVLVPEIALTPQLVRRFLRRFGTGVALFHSGLTPSQRLDEWRRIYAGLVNIVIAARSGIFVPLDNLGLIVVDEEHDPSYKQEDTCPYNARDMALARAKLEGACVILGSATPSFETFLNASRGRITRLDLPSRHHGGALPSVEVVDLKTVKQHEKKGAFLTSTLIKSIDAALNKHDQVVLFLNRRGFDTFSQCRSCGYVFRCPNCDVSLTHHKRTRDLRCHMCGFSRAAPPLCPQCRGTNMFFGGAGTQKVEEQVAALFPEARIERLDRDSTRRREDLEGILERFRRHEIDILAGTQMIVKGHDFPGIALVGVLCGDLSLHFPDFRAAERTFQLITQVAGRTGREKNSGRVILQTFDPDHYAIRHAAAHAYEAFFQSESALREELLYPPFGHLILIRIEGNSEKRVEDKAVAIGRAARQIKGGSREMTILGPAPAPRRKLAGRFRWHVLFKSAERRHVRDLVRNLAADGHLKGHGLKIVVDVDPVDML
ncbi:MAG: primosomal protein N' [Desulfomonile sp.]|nr:primosomal protein N' [Desulfomonile sp.]